MEKLTIKTQKLSKIKNFKGSILSEDEKQIYLHSTKRGRIAGHSTGTISTGMAIEIPEDHVGLVMTAENLLDKFPLEVRNFSILPNNRKEIILRVFNYSPYPEEISINQVLAKILIVPAVTVKLKGVAKLKQVTEDK